MKKGAEWALEEGRFCYGDQNFKKYCWLRGANVHDKKWGKKRVSGIGQRRV